jgi:hypothetical protein
MKWHIYESDSVLRRTSWEATKQFGPSETPIQSQSTHLSGPVRLYVSNAFNCVVAYPGLDYIHVLNSCAIKNPNTGIIKDEVQKPSNSKSYNVS